MEFDPTEFVAIAREELAPSAHRRAMSVGHIDVARDEVGSLSYEREDHAVVLIVDPQRRSVDLRFGDRDPATRGSYRSVATWPLRDGGRSITESILGFGSRRGSPTTFDPDGLRLAVRRLVSRAEGRARRVFGRDVDEASRAKAVSRDAQWYGFFDLVRAEAGPLITRHRLAPAHLFHLPRGTFSVWTNGRRAVSFQLETMDGYMDVAYGYDRRTPEWTARGSWWTGGLRRILHDEGVAFPNGPRELYVPGGQVAALRLLIEAMERHEPRIFGSDWDADGA